MVSLASLNFNAEEVKPASGDFEPIPDGKYIAIITGSEKKETNARTGHYLSLTLQIIEGQYSGRLLWTILNIWNPNPKATEIALGELSSICRAVGIGALQESTELHDRPMQIKVVVKRRTDTGAFKNEVKGYYKIGDGKPAFAGNRNGSQPQVVTHPQPAAASSAPARPPWKQG